MYELLIERTAERDLKSLPATLLIEIPADETQALALGHFDVLRILKTCKFPSESDLEPLNIELLNRGRH